MIEGESEASSYWVSGGHHYEMAVKHNALIFVVEHRYYGQSSPFSTYSNSNLQYLSSQQALGDLAVLVEFLKDKYGFSITNNRIITFGGSYPGNLAAWARIKYPHLFYAAVASSAPVMAKLDFYEYNQVVTRSFANPVVGGSKDCAHKIRNLFNTIGQTLSSNDTAEISALYKSYNVCPIDNSGNGPSDLDKAYFVEALANQFMGTVQYNRGTQIGDQCAKMLQPFDSEQCVKLTYSSMIDQLKDESVTSSSSYRQWIYQTCTQFGYYQTCENNNDGNCLFASQLNLDYFTKTCRDTFGFASGLVDKRIQFSNDYYGGNLPQGSRILFVNGEIDPWHALSIQKNLENDQNLVLISDGSHCQNMFESSAEDSEVMKAAKKKIEAKVDEWLSQHVIVIM
jgi:serine protease 16